MKLYEEVFVEDKLIKNSINTVIQEIDRKNRRLVGISNELKVYKNALDKACEMLSSISSCDCLHKRLYENEIFNESDRKAYVKEYLLKEVQNGK